MVSPTSLRISSYTINHLIVFFLTFFSYAFLHATRKAFGNIKPLLIEVWTPTFSNTSIPEKVPDVIWNSNKSLFSNNKDAETFLGALDSIFMVSYAIGLYISGILGDKFDSRIVLSIGMMTSAITVFIFGVVTEWFKFYNMYFYGFMWVLNGLFQSAGWPCALAIMSNWFGKSRGLIFGIWSACASVGNIIGDLLVAKVIHYGYQFGLLLPCSVLFSGGLLIFCGLITHPEEVNVQNNIDTAPLLINDTDNIDEDASDAPVEPLIKQYEHLSLFKILCLPGVVLYSLAYACLKLINYSFFFWLPFYLSNKFKWDTAEADTISIYYDIGGIIGGITAGLISDIMFARSPINILMLILAIPSLYVYSTIGPILWQNSLVMGVMGFFIGGPANIISSAISADLGSQKTLEGNADALATVAGIIDGTGSIGAAIGQLIVPIVQIHFGWHIVFYIFMVMSALTVVCILPIFIKDVKHFCIGYICNAREEVNE